MRLPRAWFLPETHDVLGTITAQLDIVETMISVLATWCAGTGGEDTVVQLRSLLATEHETRRRLHIQVRSSFSTPLAAEDLFELGERLGGVAERAYAVAREAELSRTAPDPRLGRQVEAIGAAMTSLAAAIRALPHGHAATLADESLEQLTRAELGMDSFLQSGPGTRAGARRLCPHLSRGRITLRDVQRGRSSTADIEQLHHRTGPHELVAPIQDPPHRAATRLNDPGHQTAAGADIKAAKYPGSPPGSNTPDE